MCNDNEIECIIGYIGLDVLFKWGWYEYIIVFFISLGLFLLWINKLIVYIKISIKILKLRRNFYFESKIMVWVKWE